MTVYADDVRNNIDENLFGHFMEHAFGNIYGGIYEPGHPLADEDGFRKDVLQALRDSGVTMLRYPGGNFVSNYHWKDGIGPREKRRRVFEYAWKAEESNQFGTVEFIKLCRKAGAKPCICVNMGTGTAEEAMHWVEFCNGTGNTHYANLRRKLGYPEPFQVEHWGLGNEMYGPWQMGYMEAKQYAKAAVEFAKAMRLADPAIKLTAVGYELDTDWNHTVVKELKYFADYLSLHHYSQGKGSGPFVPEDYRQCLYIPLYIEELTEQAYAGIIAAGQDARTSMRLAWDEWNVKGWNVPGINEDRNYTLQDAILTALIFQALIRKSDKIAVANYSVFVNINGCISVYDKGIVKRATFPVFPLMHAHAGNAYLKSRLEGPDFVMEEVKDNRIKTPDPMFQGADSESRKRLVSVPYVHAAVSMEEAEDTLTITLVNAHPEEDCRVTLRIYGRECMGASSCITVSGPGLDSYNDVLRPDCVGAAESNLQCKDDPLCVVLPKHSVNLIKWKLKKSDGAI